MCARSCGTSIAATDLPTVFLFFEPGGRPRRFAFFAMETSMREMVAYTLGIPHLSCRCSVYQYATSNLAQIARGEGDSYGRRRSSYAAGAWTAKLRGC